jgi:hypothetical protein
MPDLSYQIQLTSIGKNSGPYYNVTFTTASTFFPVLTGTPAFLPTTNSIANVTIPSGSFDYLAFNLDNGVDPCDLCDYDVTFIVTGSEPPPPPPPPPVCCTPTIINTQLSGSTTSSLFVNYTAGTGIDCLTCSFVTLQTSSDGGANWGGDVTGSCVGSNFLIAAPACSTTGSYRLQQTCSGSVTSSYSATASFSNTCIPPDPVEYIIDIAASGTFVGACGGSTTRVSVFADPGNDIPIVGMILYDDNTLTTPFIGSPGWRKLTGSGIDYAAEVDVNGEITNYGNC